jgi:hypothetical protein
MYKYAKKRIGGKFWNCGKSPTLHTVIPTGDSVFSGLTRIKI